MIRVLHVLGGLNLGGAETMVMNLYRAVDRTRIQFDFIIHLPDKQDYEDEIFALGGIIYRFPAFNGKNFLSQMKLWDSFFESHPEYYILHSHIRSYASLYIPIAKKHNVTTIIHSHSTSNGYGVSSIIKTIMQYPLRYQADYFFGCSKEAGEWLFGKKIVNGSRYYMINNAIDLQKYAPDESIRLLYRNKLNVNRNTNVFMHVGRFHESKNHMFLLDIFSEYLKSNSNSVLVLIGDGELRSELVKRILELQIENNVKMIGAQKDVPNWLKAADCFLFPSKWEGLPVTVIEAQAAGLPCLISDTITKDVNVSMLVKNIPIDRGVTPWVTEMASIKKEKIDVRDDIIKAGFDIHYTANWITDFYLRLATK